VDRERAIDLAEHLLRNLDDGQETWPLSLVTAVYVFGSFARGALTPGDLDIDIEKTSDEQWSTHFVRSLSAGRDPFIPLRKALATGRRGYQFVVQYQDMVGRDFEMTLLWKRGDTLDAAMKRLHAIQIDPAAGRAERDSMLPEFEGIDDWIPRPYRESLSAAVGSGAIRIERLVLPDSQVASPVAARHIQRRWKPTSPLLRAASAVVGYWEQRGIDPGQGHLHGTDIRDQETPYFANFNWSHFRAIPHCLAECGGAEWLEVVHPTRNGALDCLCIIPLDRKKVKELRW
jgi:hypothetical protein